MKKLIPLLFGSVLAFTCQYATADDPVTITVTGTIVASPCTVDPNSVTKDVSLGDISAADMPSAWSDFYIDLINCPAGTSTVTATLHGTPDTDNAANFQNTGTAKNVAVEISTGGVYLPLSNDSTRDASISNGSAQFYLTARAVSTNGGVTPGTVNSVLTLSFTYN